MATLPTDVTGMTAAQHRAHHADLHTVNDLADAAGDLLVGAGADAWTKLPLGAALRHLRVNAAGTGLEYVDPTTLFALAAARAFRGYRNTALSIPNDTATAIGLDAEAFDTDSIHDTATNNSRMILNKVGLWAVAGQIYYQANATGIRQARIHRNGTFDALNNILTVGSVDSSVVQALSLVRSTAITDYAELCAYQNCGSSLPISTGASVTWAGAVFLGVM